MTPLRGADCRAHEGQHRAAFDEVLPMEMLPEPLTLAQHESASPQITEAVPVSLRDGTFYYFSDTVRH